MDDLSSAISSGSPTLPNGIFEKSNVGNTPDTQGRQLLAPYHGFTFTKAGYSLHANNSSVVVLQASHTALCVCMSQLL